ncbi:MAG: hypothetical protein ACLFOC_11210 [Campylobacterales bacterium]
MISHTTKNFRELYKKLPTDIQKRAKKQYKLFKVDSFHPSLNFKRVHSALPIFSARINISYRAVGTLQEDTIVWFWIGDHDDYEKLLKNMGE